MSNDWLKTFQTGLPDNYRCRAFNTDDGLMEGVEIDHPIIGGTLEKDGVPVAYAGVNLIAGMHYVFFFIKDDEVRKYGLWIVRLIRDSLKACKASGITTLYGLCDTTKPNANGFMTTLGFRPVSVYDRTVEMLVYEKLMGGTATTWRRIEGEN